MFMLSCNILKNINSIVSTLFILENISPEH